METDRFRKRLFISYSRINHSYADEIDNYLKVVGFQILRDIRDVKLGYSIPEFIQRIKNSDFIIMLLSRGYLKSRYCMYESLLLLKEKKLENHVFPILLDSIEDLSDSKNRKLYYDFWAEQLFLATEESLSIQDSVLSEELKMLFEIRENLSEFFTLLLSINQIRFESLKKSNYSEVFKGMGFRPEALIHIVLDLRNIEDPDERDWALERILLEHPNDEFVMFFKANELLEAKLFRKAQYYLERVIAYFPGNEHVHGTYGTLLMKELKEYPAAKIQFERALEINPESPVNNSLGVLFHYHLKNYEKAKFFYEKAIEYFPQETEGYLNYGELMEDYFSNFSEALKYYLKAKEADPQDCNAYNRAGKLLALKLNEPLAGKKILEEAISIGSADAVTYSYLAIILHDFLKDLSSAKENYEKAILNDPNYPDAYFNLANLYLESNSPMKALEFFNRTLEVDHKFIGALINRASLLEESFQDIVGAKADYELAISVDPNSFKAHFNYAILLMEQFDEFEKAKIHYLKAVSLNEKAIHPYLDQRFGIQRR